MAAKYAAVPSTTWKHPWRNTPGWHDRMQLMTVNEFVSLTGGTIHGAVSLSANIEGCVIDSRQVRSGDAFFALSGSRQHGVKFCADAVRDGAVVVVVDDADSARCTTPHVSVPDAAIALAVLANHNRQQSEALVIGITGSVGKTTTRRMIASVLETVHTGVQSPLNSNNHLGVPLSLLELQQGDEFAVIEVGASGPGEIRALASIAEPEMGVITRIAPCHLNGFKSVKTIQLEKARLIAALPEDGVAFLNFDDPLVSELESCTRARVVSFGTTGDVDVLATSVVADNHQLRVTVDGTEFVVPVCGRHNVTSVLAAIAVGMEVGVPIASIQDGLSQYKPEPGRCVVSSVGPWTVIDDTYNSSPASVSAAIRTLLDYSDCHNRVLVLGDMLDLGDQAADLHYGVGASLATSGLTHIAVTGDYAEEVVEGFLASGGSLNRISQFEDVDLMTTMLDCILCDNDCVLVKGSRATQMERVIQQLQAMSVKGAIRRAA